MPTAARIVLLVIFAGLGVYLFTRALAGGGPMYYFLSAVCIGMAIASVQRGSTPKGG